MQKLITGRRTIDGESGERNLVYSILVDEAGGEGAVPVHEHYGIAVEDGETCREFRAITPSGDKILQLADLLDRNAVTTAGVDDVMDDLLGTMI